MVQSSVTHLVLLSAAAKKIKHRVVEHMTQEAADTLGLTRAVLVNGALVGGMWRVYCIHAVCTAVGIGMDNC